MPARRRGLTVMEIVVVLALLVAVAALVVPLLGGQADSAREGVTRANLVQVRDVVLGQYKGDLLGRLPRPGAAGLAAGRPDKPQLRYLFVNPDRTPEDAAPTFDPLARKGWRGPYLLAGGATYAVDTTRNFTRDYGESGDPAVMDGWNHPIVVVETVVAGAPHAEVRSAGPDGALMTADDLALTLY